MDLIKDEFVAWLKSKPRDAVVGLACAAGNCPLKRYISSKTDVVDIIVYPASYYVRQGKTYASIKHALPEWARLFVRNLDISVMSQHSSVPVTAARALRIIDQI